MRDGTLLKILYFFRLRCLEAGIIFKNRDTAWTGTDSVEWTKGATFFGLMPFYKENQRISSGATFYGWLIFYKENQRTIEFLANHQRIDVYRTKSTFFTTFKFNWIRGSPINSFSQSMFLIFECWPSLPVNFMIWRHWYY